MFIKSFLMGARLILIGTVFIIIALFMQNCFGSSKHRRGKLSDAMEEASDEHEGDREVETQPDPDYEEDETEYIIGTAVQPNSLTEEDSLAADSVLAFREPELTWLTIAGGTGLMRSDDYFGLNHFNLALGAYPARQHYLELAAGISWAPIQEASLLNESLDGGVTLLQLSLGYKYFTSPGHTFMSIFLTGGLGYTYMHWSYKNPFQAMAYDEYGNALGMETISGDGLSGFEIYIGLGLNLIQTKNVQLGAEGLPGLVPSGSPKLSL